MRHYEIERRYLLPPCGVKTLLGSLSFSYETIPIIQFYLPTKEGSLRFRRAGNRYYRTFKRGEGLVRYEEEVEISKEEFAKAMENKEGRLIVKTRYRFRYENRIYELDRFHKKHKGLVLLETEFDDNETARNFTLPKNLSRTVLEEVTKNRAFENHALALEGIPTISKPLEELIDEVDLLIGRTQALKATVSLVFHPYEKSLHLAQVYIYALLQIVRNNKNAILHGDDHPERLHQLRVAMRKIRSFLSAYAPYAHPKSVHELRTKLKEIMKKTNEARDLDVHLEWLERFESTASKEMTHGIEALKKSIVQKRITHHDTLLRTLRSASYEKTLHAIETFCRTEPTQKKGMRPAVIVAKALLKKQLKKMRKTNRQIGKNSPPEHFHRMRIQVKKFRYLLELHGSILMQEAYKELYKEVKTLQKFLGEYQDISVQLDFLQNLETEKEHHSLQSLITHLQNELLVRREEKKNLYLKNKEQIETFKTRLQKALCRTPDEKA